MGEIEEVKEEINKFTDSVDGLSTKIDRLNTLLEHYMYNVHGIRSPNAVQDVPKTTEH